MNILNLVVGLLVVSIYANAEQACTSEERKLVAALLQQINFWDRSGITQNVHDELSAQLTSKCTQFANHLFEIEIINQVRSAEKDMRTEYEDSLKSVLPGIGGPSWAEERARREYDRRLVELNEWQREQMYIVKKQPDVVYPSESEESTDSSRGAQKVQE